MYSIRKQRALANLCCREGSRCPVPASPLPLRTSVSSGLLNDRIDNKSSENSEFDDFEEYKNLPAMKVEENFEPSETVLRFFDKAIQLDRHYREKVQTNPNAFARLPTRLQYLRDTAKHRDVFLVATNHFHEDTSELTREVIRLVRPQTVVLELSYESYWELRNRKSPYFYEVENRNIGRYLSRKNHMQALMRFKYWREMARRDKPRGEAGVEFISAIEEAELNGARLICCDRSLETTKRKLQAEISRLYPKLDSNRVFNILTRSGDYRQDILYLQSLKIDYSKLMSQSVSITHERDAVLIHALKNLSQGNRIVGIIGRGHLPGILKNWDRLPERVKELQMTADDLIDRNNVNRVAAFGPPSPLQ